MKTTMTGVKLIRTAFGRIGYVVTGRIEDRVVLSSLERERDDG